MEKRKSLIKAVLDIYRISQAYISPRASNYGISRGQWYFFNRLLLNEDGISQEQLSEEMFVDSAHTTRAIKKLEENGFVFRKPDPDDARKKNVYVTEKSIAIKEEYHNLYKELNKILVKDFTPEELELVRSLLYRMRDNILLYMKTSNQSTYDKEIKPTDKEYAMKKEIIIKPI